MTSFVHRISKSSSRLAAKKWILFLYFFGYVLIKYSFEATSFHYSNPYLTYALDVLAIVLGCYIFFLDFRFYSRLKKRYIFEALGFLLLGYGIYCISHHLFLGIPIDFYNPFNVFLLVVLGPIIEEFLFRFCFMQVFIKSFKKAYLVLLISSLVFSLSHLVALFNVPSSLYGFIGFQGVYTFIVGLYWGARYLEHRAIFWPIMLHILFNMGFYFGFLFPFGSVQ